MTHPETNILLNKTFLFITGVEGSGTTMMLKVLDTLDNIAVLGGNYWSPDLQPLAEQFNVLTERLWNKTHQLAHAEKKRIIQDINTLPIPPQYSHVVHKRSFPFLDEHHWPSLTDAKNFATDTKILIMQRNIMDNTQSILRRGFESNPGIAHRRSVSGYNLLELQKNKHLSSCLFFSYEDIIDRNIKENLLLHLATYINLPDANLHKMAKIISNPTRHPCKPNSTI